MLRINEKINESCYLKFILPPTRIISGSITPQNHTSATQSFSEFLSSKYYQRRTFVKVIKIFLKKPLVIIRPKPKL